jgi:predicted HicB family RNase H-like nuclease
MITHECDQVKMQSKAIDNSIQVCLNNCEEIQNESRKLVEKAKKGFKLSEELVSNL